jgi:hypothetical protein
MKDYKLKQPAVVSFFFLRTLPFFTTHYVEGAVKRTSMEENGISEKLHQILGLSLEEKTTGNHSGFACSRCLSLTLPSTNSFPFPVSISLVLALSLSRARAVSQSVSKSRIQLIS